MIYGIAHAALYTDRFDETIRFYKAAFGAEEAGYFRTDRNGCWLKAGDSVIEIFESEKLCADGCFKHIALYCDDVDKAFEQALSAGAEAYVPPKNICLELKEKKEMRIAFVKGINGEQIELCSGKR